MIVLSLIIRVRKFSFHPQPDDALNLGGWAVSSAACWSSCAPINAAVGPDRSLSIALRAGTSFITPWFRLIFTNYVRFMP